MVHRIRVAGIIRRENKILLIEQENPRNGHRIWSIPGGGLEPGDADIFRGVEREIFEETGLKVRAGNVRFVSEYANTLTQILQIGIWIECFPVEDTDLEAITLENTLEDDYITGINWWTRSELETGITVSRALLKAGFWDGLSAPEGHVTYLGRTGEHV